MESRRLALLVDEPQRAGFGPEQPGPLRGRAAERGGRRFGVHRTGREDVERLGEDRGEVVVLGADDDPAALATCLPEEAGALARLDRTADPQRQLQAKPEPGDA